MFKIGDLVQVINKPEIIFQIKEFHYNGIIIHDGLLIEERLLKLYEEPQDSWFPDEVGYKVEDIINDRYNEHYHTVDNTTGMCITCGENVDGS